MYDMACMSSGFKVENVEVFSRTFYNILNVGLGGLDDVDVDEDEDNDGDDGVNEDGGVEVNEVVSNDVEGVEMEQVD
jgi:hypothetical protein